MSHDRELADQDLEEVAEELWTLPEESRDSLADLRRTSQVAGLDEALRRMSSSGLTRVDGERVVLTPAGRALAERQVRRHRLAEALFMGPLEVHDDGAVNRTACVMEHVLDAALTDSVCAFLGHPTHCPHGKPIPAGPCCHAFAGEVSSLVHPLARMTPGDTARVVHVVGRGGPRLARLANLGVVPGALVHLQQTSPALVIRLGETTLALEPEIAADIYVSPHPSAL
jgi:DtxR family Mn-dependent transcriptional regulator